LLLQSCIAIAAAGSINLDHAFEAFIGKLHTSDGHRATKDFQDVARPCADAPQISRCQSRDGVTDILDASFRNAQRNRRGRVTRVFRIVRRESFASCVISQVSQSDHPQMMVGSWSSQR
jgi:hypothetical protein